MTNLFRPTFLSALSLTACLSLIAFSADSASAQSVRVRSGNNGSGVANGFAELSTNGGGTWTDITSFVGVEYSVRFGNARSNNGNYQRASDTSGILGVSANGTGTDPVITASLVNIGTAAGGTGTSYQGTVAGTDTLEVKQVGGADASGQVYNRIFFSFAAPTANFYVNGLARSDNAGYDAILNYNTASMQTMDQFALNSTTPPSGNAIRTTANVPSSYTFSDSAVGGFTGGGTQTFSIVWRNDPQPSSISFDVNFQPVPAPPAAISLGIGGLVGLMSTSVAKLRSRRRKQAAKQA